MVFHRIFPFLERDLLNLSRAISKVLVEWCQTIDVCRVGIDLGGKRPCLLGYWIVSVDEDVDVRWER